MTAAETETTASLRAALLTWFGRVRRSLPWRDVRDPYRIWLSEVMLQQTRVDQALPYYERFTAAFPTVADLAKADLDDVLLAWEGLGYYRRARDLHRAAGLVLRDHGGRLPSTYDELRALPGVGDYTASAVASIAFGVPEAALDGNVIRVLCRFDAVAEDPRSAQVRRRLRARAQELLDPQVPGMFNEAMMELGATVCTPTCPDCDACPLTPACLGRSGGDPEAYPVRTKKPAVPHHDIAVGIVRRRGRLLIQQRPAEGLLGGLWEFPGGKCLSAEAPRDACVRELREELGLVVVPSRAFEPIRHAYSHFRITLHAFECVVDGRAQAVPRLGQPVKWVDPSQLQDYAFPRANRRLMEQLMQDGPDSWPRRDAVS